MKINIYYGGRGIVGDPTISVINRIQAVLEDINVKVQRYNLFEEKRSLTSLPTTLNEADGIILACTVEWHGIGGYMHEFLDACWLYGNKEKIAEIYMCPVVMSTTYGEREGKLDLVQAWELLGGKQCSGICGYVKDSVSFELNQTYTSYIEKKAENIYRTISQKVTELPASNQVVKQMVSAAPPISLTPQESEQLSKYASDENYLATQKEDIREIASHFKTLLTNNGISDEEMIAKEFKSHFIPQNDFSGVFKITVQEFKNALIIDIKNDQIDVRYGNVEDPIVVCKITKENLENIISGHMTFQRAFMTGQILQVRGHQNLVMLDTAFRF